MNIDVADTVVITQLNQDETLEGTVLRTGRFAGEDAAFVRVESLNHEVVFHRYRGTVLHGWGYMYPAHVYSREGYEEKLARDEVRERLRRAETFMTSSLAQDRCSLAQLTEIADLIDAARR